MVTKEILQSHPVSVLKKEISKSNVKGYSRMKKAEVIELMLKHKEKFSHIEMATSVPKKEKKKVFKFIKTKAKKDKKTGKITLVK
jgi:hypothetical protein